MATEHTPLPWETCQTFGGNNDAISIVADDRCIAAVWDRDWQGNDHPVEANAAFITRACNSHYQLVEALADARQSLAVAIHGLPEMLERNALTDEEDMVGSLQAAIERIDAALKLAGGQQ